jgi:hypothetical protein
MLVQFSFLILSLPKDSIIRRVAVVVVCLFFFFVDALINDASRRGAERLSRCRADRRLFRFSCSSQCHYNSFLILKEYMLYLLVETYLRSEARRPLPLCRCRWMMKAHLEQTRE